MDGQTITSLVTQRLYGTAYGDTASQDPNSFSLEQAALRVRETVLRRWLTEHIHPTRKNWKFQRFTHLCHQPDDTDSYSYLFK